MIQEFADVLRKQIRDDLNNYADDIAGGICKSFDEYQKLCGVIQGLAVAESYVIALAKKVEESDE
tara:strand:+ start:283 stop:477 length:195 start_codon:yes stop_codon:yes gene_type:complete